MNAEGLNSRLKRYGADVEGIDDRFMGDAELYEECLADFFNDANFHKLTSAVGSADYGDAFDAAHALKGLSGNLGLTPFYENICILVETLRAKQYQNVQNQYANVMSSLRDMADVFADEPNLGAPLPKTSEPAERVQPETPAEPSDAQNQPASPEPPADVQAQPASPEPPDEPSDDQSPDPASPEEEPPEDEPSDGEFHFGREGSWEQDDGVKEHIRRTVRLITPEPEEIPDISSQDEIKQPREDTSNEDTPNEPDSEPSPESPVCEPSETPNEPSDGSAEPQNGVQAPAREPFYKALFKRVVKNLNEKGPNVLIVGAILLLIVIFVVTLFANLINNYNRSNAASSADHLQEICYQLKLYVEEDMDNNWKVAKSIAASVSSGNFDHDDFELLSFVRKQRDVWGVTDIIVYATDGLGINSSGEASPNDVASQTVYDATQRGEYLTVINSELIYTIPVQSEETLSGSKIVAVSVCHDVATFLDGMGFSSFDGNAVLYLSQNNGALVSTLTNKNALSAYNMLAVLDNMNLRTLNGKKVAASTMFGQETMNVYMISSPRGAEYVVCVPIQVQEGGMSLFYIVPEALVNESARSFSSFVTLLSAVLISIVLAGVLFIFVNVYNSSKRRFDMELLSREHMYELLATSTQTAFGFYRDGRPKPAYVTKNVKSVMGREPLLLENDGDHFYVRGTDDDNGADIRVINEAMREWDGMGRFSSGYIKNAASIKPRYYEMQLSGSYDGQSEVICIVQDATEAYERENALKEALGMAESANRAKSRFLSNMSHDIRTPMNAIVNMTNFAIDSLDNPKRMWEYLQTIRKSSDHLLALINDVLTMSRIESGKNAMNDEPFDIVETLNRLSEIMRPLCKSKNLTFITDFSNIQYKAAFGDEVKLSQILMNLLSNAVKYTPNNGAVRFSASQIDSIRDDMINFRFVVEDNGIGISEKNVAKIFEPFSRVDDKRTSGIEGSGLGLSICHSFVMAMGGTLTCESEEGNGSTFTVELMFKKGTETVVQKAIPAQLNVPDAMPFLGKHCIVCEDNPTNLTIAKTLLERLGFLVDSAGDGWECVNTFKASKPGLYDIIYMDIQMPVMDGYEAAVAIRESDHQQAKTIPIIAMTANVFAEDVEKARIAGMNGHVGKPIFTIDLVRETDRALNGVKEDIK